MIVAALLAAVANYSLLRADDTSVVVAVAGSDIVAGSRIDAATLSSTRIDAPDEVLADLMDPAATDLDGKVAVVDIPAGTLLRRADLIDASSDSTGLRQMSIPIDRADAVGGAVRRNDTVDVIQSVDGAPRYVVAGARVIAVAESASGGLGNLERYFLTIEVDADTALCLAGALDTGDLRVLLSTGADPVTSVGCGTPGGLVPTGADAAGSDAAGTDPGGTDAAGTGADDVGIESGEVAP